MTLEIERPLLQLEEKIKELERLNATGKVDLSAEIRTLRQKVHDLKRDIFQSLSAWDRVQLARHPKRPTTLDHVDAIFDEFLELHGDRLFSDDLSIVGGLAKLDSRPVMILGHQKGKDTKENLKRNFGMSYPEGFRKAGRLMQLAEKLHVPVVCFVDTPGAYPGIGAEERGQFEAIARNLQLMSVLRTPIVITVIGEGGSGGALALGMGDRVLIMEYAYFSVISPEGCASILWRDGRLAPKAAEALQLTSDKLFKLNLVDEVVPEPLGGAHCDPSAAFASLKECLVRNLQEISKHTTSDLLDIRYGKYRRMGVFNENGATVLTQFEESFPGKS